jgi:hypothetical protein
VKPRRTQVSIKRDPAIRATRTALKAECLVYVLVADRRLQYPGGRSKIVYIGTTSRGIRRVASSIARRAADVLANRGVRAVEAFIVTCRDRPRVEMRHKLERALLMTFREGFGEPPSCNVQGRRMKPRDELLYFRQKRLNAVIEELS